MNDQERISPCNIMQLSIENKEKYQLGDYQLIHHQIPGNNITRIVWQSLRIIANEIFRAKGLN